MSEAKELVGELHQRLTKGNQLKRYLSRHASSADEAAEIYQESIVRVLERAKETSIQNPLAYVIRVARNLLIKPTDISIDEVDDIECEGLTPEEQISQHQRIELISAALVAMPALRRQVFLLRREQGESRQNIASKLELSVEAVSKHLSRAMADIQQHLDKNS